MKPEDQSYLRTFFQALAKAELEPDDPLYVDIYKHPEMQSADPVDDLERRILWTPGCSVQLFSGFRGTGKSTQLRRLKANLEQQGLIVVLVDIGRYLNLHQVIDVPDFLFAVAGGFGDTLMRQGLLPDDPSKRGYWARMEEFLTRTNVTMEELGFSSGVGVDIKAALRDNPSFRKRLQEKMGQRLEELVQDVHEYIGECVSAVREHQNSEAEVVVLVDTMEQIRGIFSQAQQVQESVERLFAGYPDKLHLPGVHVVYTVPPFLKVRFPGIGGLYDPGGLRMLPAVKVRGRESGDPFRPGIDALEQVVAKRGDWQRLLGEREVLDELILLSGGHLRDLIRILREIVTLAKRLPVEAATVQAAVDQIRNELLPIPDKDVRWLRRVKEERSAALVDRDDLPDFARFLDSHVVLGYLNGVEWYDLHPLITDAVDRQYERLEAADGRQANTHK